MDAAWPSRQTIPIGEYPPKTLDDHPAKTPTNATQAASVEAWKRNGTGRCILQAIPRREEPIPNLNVEFCLVLPLSKS